VAQDGNLRKPGPFERVGANITPGESDLLEQVSARFDALDVWIRDELPEGREKALCRPQLELAGMLATKAVTHVPRPVPPAE
jgi:hypothetical protein